MTAPALRPMTATDWALLLLLSLLWGGSFLFGKVAAGALPSFTIVAGRVLFALVTLWLVMLVTGTALPRGGRHWVAILVMALFNNVFPFTLIIWGQKQLGAGMASTLNAGVPFFTVLLAHVMTHDERLTPAKIMGTLVGLAGVTVLIGPETSGGHLLAAVSCLAGAVCYALGGIYGRRFQRTGMNTMQLVFGQVLVAALISVPLAAVIDEPWQLNMPDWKPLVSIAAMGILSTAVAYLIFFKLVMRTGATAASLVTLMVPPSAMAMGALLLGEAITVMQIGGVALIAFGLALTDGRIVGWARRRLSGRRG